MSFDPPDIRADIARLFWSPVPFALRLMGRSLRRAVLEKNFRHSRSALRRRESWIPSSMRLIENQAAFLDRLAWMDSKDAAEYLKNGQCPSDFGLPGSHSTEKIRRRLYFRRIELERLLESSSFRDSWRSENTPRTVENFGGSKSTCEVSATHPASPTEI